MNPDPSYFVQIGDALDAAYLRTALRRAGQTISVESIRVTPFGGGGAVDLIETSSGRSYFLKRIKFDRGSWWSELIGSSAIEVNLWREGVLPTLPAPLRSPILDVAFCGSRDEWWLLMADVRKSGRYSATPVEPLLRGLVALHAKYWDADVLSRLVLCPMEGYTAVYADPIAVIAGREPSFPWSKRVSQRPNYALVPQWLDAMTSGDREFYLDLWRNRRAWYPEIERMPKTLIHHDLHAGNFSVYGEELVWLFDWNYAARGPAAFDLAYYSMLTFWSVVSNQQRSEEEARAMQKQYMVLLSLAVHDLDAAEVRRSWDLCWLAAFVQSAHMLIRPLVGLPDAREAIRAIAARAVSEAKWIVEKHFR